MVKIRFYFPSVNNVKDKKRLVYFLMQAMRKDGGIKYAGYLNKKELQKDLLRHIGDHNFSRYKPPSARQQRIIEDDICSAVKKCQKVLPHPDLPIFVFVYPWFPGEDDRAQFEGITALAAYYTIHLFVDLSSYTRSSLEKTIAHEWNHLVFYRYNPGPQYTLGAHILMEGFAEVFREEVMGGESTPWALALSRKEVGKQVVRLRQKLNVKDMDIYREVFFGGKKYKHWTGYSIGYRLIKEFREKHPKFSWGKIIKTRPEDIMRAFIKKGA